MNLHVLSSAHKRIALLDALQVQLGGDRYSYLPDLAACPLVAAAVANALGSPDHKGEQSALLPSSGNRLVRLLMILVGSGTALWACFLTTPGALLFWRSDETALRHGLAIDPVRERVGFDYSLEAYLLEVRRSGRK